MKGKIVYAIACVCALAAFADAKPTVCVMASLKDGSSTPLISLKCRCNEKVS